MIHYSYKQSFRFLGLLSILRFSTWCVLSKFLGRVSLTYFSNTFHAVIQSFVLWSKVLLSRKFLNITFLIIRKRSSQVKISKLINANPLYRKSELDWRCEILHVRSRKGNVWKFFKSLILQLLYRSYRSYRLY